MLSNVWIVIKKYMGEIFGNIQNVIFKLKRDFIKGNVNNAKISHILETNRNFNFKDSKMLLCIHKKLN